ncbi:hypothetical protein GMW39_18740 [Pectobacterium parmentieri]|uniref:hypothetical protein n=1 Tax=Pectobacterium parmentieri TaxID=1905730 RepID=UPI0004737BDC|nr:hypothetical protein [Pectobacterium parmentieri]AYH03957.1 hypothetical protein C5E25_00275 [Pectobacterium parmentieri]MBN3179655.1 hypothetical protein [Pectobacterium parmentieri]PWD60676.1 hypothetical protein DF211_16360 [Pectobacterium parmentieri]QHQ17666.1 hypothetical protein GMW39_18740 [Pectobacterium parmentieri]
MKGLDEIRYEFEKINSSSLCFLEKFRSDVKDTATKEKISKGRLINFRPFEAERFGFKLGKELTSLPARKKDIQVWQFDSEGKIVLVERFGSTGSIQYSDFYFYSTSVVRIIGFYNVDSLAFVIDVLFDRGKIIKELSYGKFGSSVSNYNYSGDMLVDIVVHEKEHDHTDFSTHSISFCYESGDLKSIMKKYPNGYSEQRYP